MKAINLFILSLFSFCLVASLILVSGELLIVAGTLLLGWCFIQWRAANVKI